MKKFIALLIAGMIVLLCGCSSGSSDDSLGEHKEPDSNYEFDYFLDKVESYEYYDYLTTGYITPIDGDIIFHTLQDVELNINNYSITDVQVGNYYADIDYRHEYHKNPIYPIRTVSDTDLWKGIYGRGFWKELYNCYDDYDSEKNLPINKYSGLGTQLGRSILEEEHAKILRIGTAYYEVHVLREEIHLENCIVNIDEHTELYQLMNEKLIYPFTNYDGKNIVHYIEWSSWAFSTKLTLNKL